MRELTLVRILSASTLAFAALLLSGCTKDSGSSSAASGGGAANVSGARADGTSMTADDQAAAAYFQGKLEERWVKNSDGWTMQLQRRNLFGEPMDGVPGVLYLQYRDLKYHMQPVALTESQKLNGTTYRAEISFEYVPTRRFHTDQSIEARPGWSNWDEEQPAATLVVELRNGKWLMTDAEMLAGLKPDPNAIPTGP